MAIDSKTHKTCCHLPTFACPCPACGNKGRKVASLTLDNHVPSPLREKLGNEASFCLNPNCDVIYCNPQGFVVRKGEINFPVTIKDPGDDVYVCYCFKHTRGNIRRDLKEKGATDIPDQIRQGVKEGRCNCEKNNPQGACCLGNVANAIKAIQAELKQI